MEHGCMRGETEASHAAICFRNVRNINVWRTRRCRRMGGASATKRTLSFPDSRRRRRSTQHRFKQKAGVLGPCLGLWCNMCLGWFSAWNGEINVYSKGAFLFSYSCGAQLQKKKENVWVGGQSIAVSRNKRHVLLLSTRNFYTMRLQQKAAQHSSSSRLVDILKRQLREWKQVVQADTDPDGSVSSATGCKSVASPQQRVKAKSRSLVRWKENPRNQRTAPVLRWADLQVYHHHGAAAAAQAPSLMLLCSISFLLSGHYVTAHSSICWCASAWWESEPHICKISSQAFSFHWLERHTSTDGCFSFK